MSKLVFDGETLITLIELNNKGYQDSSAVAAAIATAVNGLATDASVEAAIATAVNGLATDASVEAAIASAIEGIATDASVASAIETAINGLATNASVASAIETAVAGLATNTSVEAAIASATEGIATDASVEAAIASAINGLATDASVEAAIATAVDGLATDASVEAAIASATEGLVSDASLQEALADVSVDLSGYATDASVEAAIIAKGYQTASQVTTIANDTINGYVGGTGEVMLAGNVFIPAKDAVPTVQADYTSGTPAYRFINNAGVKNDTKRLVLQGIPYALLKNVTSAQEYTVNLGLANYVDKPITVRSIPSGKNIFILGWSDENHTQAICGGLGYQKKGYGYSPKAFCYKLNSDETDVVSIYAGSDSTTPTVTLTPNFSTGDKVWDKWYPLLKPKAGINLSWNATITDGSTEVKIYDVIMAIQNSRMNGSGLDDTYMNANQTLTSIFNSISSPSWEFFDALCPVNLKGYSFSDNQLVHAYEQGLDPYEELPEKLSKFLDVSLYDGKKSIADPSISFEAYDFDHRTILADHVANDASIAVVTVKWEDPYDDPYSLPTDPMIVRYMNNGNSQADSINVSKMNNISPDALLKIDGWNYAINCHIPLKLSNMEGYYANATTVKYYNHSNTQTQLQYHIGEIAITTKNEYDVLVETVESITNAGYQTAADVSTAISTAMSSAFHMVTLSQQDYDALQVKAPNTLYIISD